MARDRDNPMCQLLDAMEDSVALLAVDGTILEINASGAGRLGRPRAEIVGLNYFDLTPPVAAARRRRLAAEIVQGGESRTFTEEVRGRYLEHRVRPLRGPDGAVSGLAVHIEDVTERLLAEHERQAKSVELETIHSHVPVGILLLDTERRVTKANEAVARMAGVPRDDIIDRIGGAALGCLNHLDDERGCGYGPHCGTCDLRLALLHALDDGIIINGLPVTLPVEGPDGREPMHVLVSAAPITLQDRRQVLVSLQDITRLRQAEADVAFKANVLDQIQDRVTVTDLQGTVVYVNDAACRSLKLDRAALIGNSVSRLGENPERGATQREIVEGTLANGSWQGEVVNIAADGAEVLLHCRTALVRDGHGEPIGMCGIATDITERRRLESQLRQAQKLDALGRLAAGVSHDFNNQLTVISGYCDLLLEQTPADGAQRPALEQIRRATERALSTTGHLLAFSRKRDLAPRAVDINELLREISHPVGKLIGETIRIRMELSPRLRPVWVDPGALQQAVFNLIINARDAMPDGGNLVLRTANRPAAGGGQLVTLSIEDDGHGISAEDLERVFEPFFTTKAEGRGTGLGLPMVRGFAEQSGGTIEMHSRPGSGTTASILLPAMAEDGRAPTPVEDGAEPARLAARVLVAEDSDSVRELLCDVLHRQGAEVVATASAEEALAAAGAGAHFDLLVTDVVMPGLRGDDLAKRLTAAGRVDRVIYISGYQGSQSVSLDAPLLGKPFAVQDFIDLARDVLGPSAIAAGAPGSAP